MVAFLSGFGPAIEAAEVTAIGRAAAATHGGEHTVQDLLTKVRGDAGRLGGHSCDTVIHPEASLAFLGLIRYAHVPDVRLQLGAGGGRSGSHGVSACPAGEVGSWHTFNEPAPGE